MKKALYKKMNEPRTNDKLYLSHKSLFGKKTIQENGSVWIVLEIRDKVLACRNKKGMKLESILNSSWRWIALEEDRDFFWQIIVK